MNPRFGHINILCFGDSNTWGFDADNQRRFPSYVRWPSVLQKFLLPAGTVHEFGICDMTFATDDSNYLGRNGLSNIIPAICANSPLDYIIVHLGPNECKSYHGNSLATIENHIEEFLVVASEYKDLNTDAAQVIVVGPPDYLKSVYQHYPEEFNSGSFDKLLCVAEIEKKVCLEYAIPFIDTRKWRIDFCADGLHYSQTGHETFAGLLFQELRKIIY